MDDCVDDATFDNGSGATCAAYSQWCADGGARPGSEWALGAQFNHPERHCCACGKPGAAEEAETAADSEEIAGRAELRQAAERRADACAALAPRTAPSFALVYWRLPRVGNALMCAVLGACSHAQVETCAAAPGGHVVDACAAGAPWQYTDYASAKLPAASRSCFQRLDDLPLGGDQAAGWANLEATCSTMGGDVAATCSYLRGLAQPATAMVRLERFVEPTAAPCRRAQFWRNSAQFWRNSVTSHPLSSACSWAAPPVRMIAMLRDPGERAQSAYEYGLDACVCSFRYPSWCTMFTSFRFGPRRAALCDGAKPRHSFGAAMDLLRASGPRLWPAATGKAEDILGRYAATVTTNVYAPFFGSWQPKEEAPWEESAALARVTLSRCFAWVGIAEEMPLSLRLLKAEIPTYFQNLDPDHAAFAWAPASGAASSNASHPYLRQRLLSADYKVYDGERARLHRRAAKALGRGWEATLRTATWEATMRTAAAAANPAAGAATAFAAGMAAAAAAAPAAAVANGGGGGGMGGGGGGGLLAKMAKVEAALGLPPGQPLAAAVKAANDQVGLPSSGPLSQQVDALVAALGR